MLLDSREEYRLSVYMPVHIALYTLHYKRGPSLGYYSGNVTVPLVRSQVDQALFVTLTYYM